MRRFLLSILAFVLSFSVLAGCTNGNDPSQGSDDQSNGGQTENKGNEPTKFSISLRTKNMNYVENHANINEDKYVKKLEEMTNTDLDIILVPHAQYEEKMAQMFATGDIPDVVQANGGLYGQELMGSVQEGVFMDLTPILEEYGQNLLKTIPQDAWDQVTEDGKIYGIPEWLGNPSRRATWIRKDLLDQTGLPVPKTVDEFLDVLRAFKELGVEQPYAARNEFKYADTFFGAYDVFGYESQLELVDGQIQPKFLDVENMQAAIQVYKTMMDEGLISKEFPTVEPSTFKSIITSGKAGMWSMNLNELPIWSALLKNNVPEAEVEIIPSPVGPDGKGGYYLYGSATRAYLINKDAEDKAVDIVKFFDWFVSEEADLFFSFGIEGEDYTVSNGEVQWTMPTDDAGVDKMQYLNDWLYLVKDTTYNRRVLEQTEEGRKMIELYDTVLANEGRDGYQFVPRLQAWVDNPQIAPYSDRYPSLINEHIMKMVYGEEPISDWPKVIEEWRSKGGDDVIKEATERYNNNEGVTPPRR